MPFSGGCFLEDLATHTTQAITMDSDGFLYEGDKCTFCNNGFMVVSSTSMFLRKLVCTGCKKKINRFDRSI
eukprot:g10333.t1